MSTVDYFKTNLQRIHEKAKKLSTCCKAQVGAEIHKSGCLSFGYNLSMPGNCKADGCHRMKIYGEDSKNHRLPSDCYAIHAEIYAIATAARSLHGAGLYGATMYVTRYPCEACARAIVAAGIKRVIYGGIEEVSEQTQQILDLGDVEAVYIPIEWGGDTNE